MALTSDTLPIMIIQITAETTSRGSVRRCWRRFFTVLHDEMLLHEGENEMTVLVM